jgi:hypothetical protein
MIFRPDDVYSSLLYAVGSRNGMSLLKRPELRAKGESRTVRGV